MILDKCCLDHIPYEILDKIPTQNDWDYPVPFIRISKKDKRAWILVDNKDAKGIWIPFGRSQNAIEKIITSCGEIIPQSGSIELIEGDGIIFNCENNKLTIGLKIPITIDQGGTGITQYTLGDLLIGNQDGTLSKLPKGENGQVLAVKEDGSLGYIDVVKKLTCDGSDPVTENALTRWNTNGKCLKDSKTVQDDDGNITTSVALGSGVKDQTRNRANVSGAHAIKEVMTANLGGQPIFRLNKNQRQIWDQYIDKDDSSYKIRGDNQQDPYQNGDFLRINQRGVFSIPFQLKCTAYLASSAVNVTGDQTEYFLGTTLPMTISNQIGNGFFVGSGTGNSAMYTAEEVGSYAFFLNIFCHTNGNAGEIITKIYHYSSDSKFINSYQNFNPVAAGITNAAANVGKGLYMQIGEKVNFSVRVGTGAKNTSVQGQKDNILTYVDIYKLG